MRKHVENDLFSKIKGIGGWKFPYIWRTGVKGIVEEQKDLDNFNKEHETFQKR